MEEIIILILFSYPGIMADYLHRLMIRGKLYDKPEEEYFRVARDFLLSVIITAASIGVYGMISGETMSLTAMAEELHGLRAMTLYLAISMIMAAAAAGVWTAGNSIRLQLYNRGRKKKGLDTLTKTQRVWNSIRNDPEIPYSRSVMAIYKDGKMLRAGLGHNITTDIREDPGMILEYTEFIEQLMENKEMAKAWIKDPVVSYVEAENGIRIDIYDGNRITDYLMEQAEKMPENQVAAG